MSASPDRSDGAGARPEAGGPDELRSVAERYARRGAPERYSLLRPEVWQMVQERQRAMLRLFATLGWSDLAQLRVAEVGCGAGGNLLELLRLGVHPTRLCGAELLADRLAQARAALPSTVSLWSGDASRWPLAPNSQDIVMQSTVFSSLLDDGFQQQLAAAMWSWVAPGGGVLWYDFTIDNPRNPDVRGVPMRRVRELFPQALPTWQRVTLAPPLARAVCRAHPSLYTLFNLLPVLRTHVLVWLQKPAS